MKTQNSTVAQAIRPVLQRLDAMEAELSNKLDAAARAGNAGELDASPKPVRDIFFVSLIASLVAMVAFFAMC